MKTQLDKLEEEIKRCSNNCVTMQMFIESANKTFLFVYTSGSRDVIRIYDENRTKYAVAAIEYRATQNYCFIDSFETIEEFQGMGIGKIIYNMALAHADMLGACYSYGNIEPIAPIKGVTQKDRQCYDEEMEVLKLIYSKLGNTFEYYERSDNTKFISKWKSGERVALLSEDQQKMMEEVVGNNKKIGY